MAATGEVTAAVTAYERLRGHVLAGRPGAGDAAALVLLLRGGIAAWLARRTAGAPAARAGGAEMPRAAEALPASLVRVLASMVLAHGGEERRSRR